MPPEIMAQLRREFQASLPGRLATMEGALEALGSGYVSDAAAEFHRSAHSLKGTAAAYEAEELIEPATKLTELGMHLLETGAVTQTDRTAAAKLLGELQRAVDRYPTRMPEGGT